MANRVTTFSIERNTKRLKHLENYAYTQYSPKRITLWPGEYKSVDIKIGITLPQNIQWTCILLPSLANERLYIVDCSTISNESIVTDLN